MSKHPITPADESDIRLHLGKQTSKKIGLLDILQLSKAQQEISRAIDQLIDNGAGIILIDALYQQQLSIIGEMIDRQVGVSSLFSAGSSGIEMALGEYWNSIGKLRPVSDWPNPGKAEPLLVISGSCSPVTIAQIAYAKSIGFGEVLFDDENALSKTIGFLQNKKSVIVHTDADNKRDLPARHTGSVLGKIAREAIAQIAVNRLVIAGGDTSSYAARAMGIESVQMIAPLVPGAPLCKATAHSSPLHNKEVNFKGGQVGGENYFETLLNGKL